jgi:adenylylsulfate kinase-like enzyme
MRAFHTRVSRKPNRRRIGVVTVFMRKEPMAVVKVISPLRAAL